MKKSTNHHIAWNVMETMTTNCTPARMFVTIVGSRRFFVLFFEFIFLLRLVLFSFTVFLWLGGATQAPLKHSGVPSSSRFFFPDTPFRPVWRGRFLAQKVLLLLSSLSNFICVGVRPIVCRSLYQGCLASVVCLFKSHCLHVNTRYIICLGF